MTQYEGVDSHPQSRHIPFAIECTGKLGKAARDFLKEAGLDDKKRSALKNEIASIIAFANGECIAMAFLKGSTRPSNLSDGVQAGQEIDDELNPNLGVSQRSQRVQGHTAGQPKPQESVNPNLQHSRHETTDGQKPITSNTSAQVAHQVRPLTLILDEPSPFDDDGASKNDLGAMKSPATPPGAGEMSPTPPSSVTDGQNDLCPERQVPDPSGPLTNGDANTLNMTATQSLDQDAGDNIDNCESANTPTSGGITIIHAAGTLSPVLTSHTPDPVQPKAANSEEGVPLLQTPASHNGPQPLNGPPSALDPLGV
jgi:hypothetical protein